MRLQLDASRFRALRKWFSARNYSLGWRDTATVECVIRTRTQLSLDNRRVENSKELGKGGPPRQVHFCEDLTDISDLLLHNIVGSNHVEGELFYSLLSKRYLVGIIGQTRNALWMIGPHQSYIQNAFLDRRGVLAKQTVQRVETAERAVHRGQEEERIDVVDQAPADGTHEVLRDETESTSV